MKGKRIETLIDTQKGESITLGTLLKKRYGGGISFPRAPRGRPYIIGNFVSTIDGVITFNIPGRSGGGEISGFNEDDMFVMALLRTLSDAVVFGSGTLHIDTGHVRVPSFIYPSLSKEFKALRRKMGKSEEPLNVILTVSGQIDLQEKNFHQSGLRTLIMTTDRGMRRLKKDHGKKLEITNVLSVGNTNNIAPEKVARILHTKYDVRLLLHEGGPRVFGQFLKSGYMDEIFLTLSPQVAGRSPTEQRLSFAGDTVFFPAEAPWFQLASLKRAGDHLLLRYARSAT